MPHRSFRQSYEKQSKIKKIDIEKKKNKKRIKKHKKEHKKQCQKENKKRNCC